MAIFSGQTVAKRGWTRAVCTAVFLSAAVAGAALAADVIKERQEAMKGQGQALKAIDGIIKAGGNPADVVEPAGKIAETAKHIPDLFPPGTDQGDTGANKEIWEKFDEFKAKAANLETQAKMLAAAGTSGNLETVRAQFDKVAGACGECHKPFRHKRN